MKNTPAPIRCHIKIDTGMGRIGLKHDTPEACAAEIEAMMKIDKLSVEGIYTHFAVADSDDPDNIAYTDKQEKFITDTYDVLVSRGLSRRNYPLWSAPGCQPRHSRGA